MNLLEYPRANYSINQFTQPKCYELAGQKFHFIMDDGYDFNLSITGNNTLLWNRDGEEPKEAVYQCLKGDDTTYLLDYELEEFLGTHNRVNHLFVIDLEQRLVTMGVYNIGENPKFPYLVSSRYIFGAIEVEGMQLPFKRHSFTSDMIGTSVEWHWGSTAISRHVYTSSFFYRFSSLGEEYLIDRDLKYGIGMELPSHEDLAVYIKIKPKMYIFCLNEELMERTHTLPDPPFRCNNMCILQNYDRMMHVGRTFGNVLDREANKVVRCYIQFGAFGNPIKLPDNILNSGNPYIT